MLAAYGAGIQVHVEDLAAHIAGRERGDADARWGELLPAYQDLAANAGEYRLSPGGSAAVGLPAPRGRSAHTVRLASDSSITPGQWAWAAAAASCATGGFLMSECAPEKGSPLVLLMTLAASIR